MPTASSFDYRSFDRWRRPFEVGFWIAFFVLNATFNSVTSTMDHPGLAPWEPWCWEWSSAMVMLALIPAVVAGQRRWPIRFETWRTSLPWLLLGSVLFSLVHVGGMVLLRTLVYTAMGRRYEFGSWEVWGYEYLKDVRSYAGIVALIALYQLWRTRFQGEARLLAEPDEGPPVEPVERPERFLVRKLGKEFLINAREIEWLQASGNYVNLHVRGRDYPLRATMASIEEKLDPTRFVRVQRSYFINLDYLAEIEPLETGDARLTMQGSMKIPCSRRYRAQLRERFGEAGRAEVARG
ncbi:MAG TPA: LytTR family DNA-binding domain-containing protein [Dyella sp.]|uniref:LytTR family DNA-binding domain-containing protein n=1 Tax=Dyella sp. TaxID=1869338 RepID=UPI002F9590D3